MKVVTMIKARDQVNGCGAHRAYFPMRVLNEIPDFECSVVLCEGRYSDLPRADIFVLQRLILPSMCKLIEVIHRQGAKAVLDLDDDLTSEYSGYGDLLPGAVAQCDAVTVSTPHLRGVMEQYGKPVHLLRNYLPCREFGEVSSAAERKIEGLAVGLAGGASHWGDNILVKDALLRLRKDYPITIVIAGYVPPYFEGLGFKAIPWVRYGALPAVLRQIDIVLKPLDSDHRRNWSKSAVGALEAMASARPVGKRLGGCIPVVSGDLSVYRGVVEHRHNGLLVKDRDWYGTVASLIEDSSLRQRLAVQGLKWVRRNRDASLAGPSLVRVYRTIMGG